MTNEIKVLLEEEIKTQIKSLSDFKSGTKEKTDAIDDLAELHKLYNNEVKAEQEAARVENENLEILNQRGRDACQWGEQKKDRWVRMGTVAGEIVIPLIFYGIWMKRGFEFEKEGTICSTTFRGLINKFRPTKK